MNGRAQGKEFRAARCAWRRLQAKIHGRPYEAIRDAGGIMDACGCLGGVADEFSPATETGRAKIRALVEKALREGWCAKHRQPKVHVPAGKFAMPEAHCQACGKRPSYCRCGK